MMWSYFFPRINQQGHEKKSAQNSDILTLSTWPDWIKVSSSSSTAIRVSDSVTRSMRSLVIWSRRSTRCLFKYTFAQAHCSHTLCSEAYSCNSAAMSGSSSSCTRKLTRDARCCAMSCRIRGERPASTVDIKKCTLHTSKRKIRMAVLLSFHALCEMQANDDASVSID